MSSTKIVSRWEPVPQKSVAGLRSYLTQKDGGLSDIAVDQIIMEAQIILGRCVSPKSNDSTKTGLICGYVQSGKTASMTAVSALARDNGFRIIILMAGVTTNLVAQNRGRLEDDLRMSTDANWAWCMLNNPRDNLGDDLELQGLVDEWRDPNVESANKRTLLLTVMKHHGHLLNLSIILGRLDLRGIPALIFDDEADQASMNTQPNDQEASSTYRNIMRLRATLPHHTYLQYTATPQAPLLITRIDALSADFAELVSPGQDYTGGQVFFVRRRDLLRSIPTQDVFNDRHLPAEPPASLLLALQVFFVGVAIGIIRGAKRHRSMLVHPSQQRGTHDRYFDWIQGLKSEWATIARSQSEPDRAELMHDFRVAYEDLCKTSQDAASCEFQEILEQLPTAITRTRMAKVNSDDGREVKWENAYSHILVGGEKLGRGYTVKGLTVTYMPRGPGGWTADTIQQRARFFGYHEPYLNLCRIYLHADVRDVYIAYVRHEEDLRRRLSEHGEASLTEWRRLFYLNLRLKPTRHNVLSTAYLRPHLSSGWFESRSPQRSALDGEHNRRVLRCLETIEFSPNESYPQHSEAVVPLREIFGSLLIDFSLFEERDGIRLCFVLCQITVLLEKDADALCTVVRMSSDGHHRFRGLNDQGHIVKLMQGRSSAGKESYPGDRAFRDPNVVTVQVYNLSLGVREGRVDYENIPTLAIHIPWQEDLLLHEE